MGAVNLPPDPPFQREEGNIRSYLHEARRLAEELDRYVWKLPRVRASEAEFSPVTEREYALRDELEARIRTIVLPQLDKYHRMVRVETSRLRDEVGKLGLASREARVRQVTDSFMNAKRAAEANLARLESLDRDYIAVRQFVTGVLGRMRGFVWPGPEKPRKIPRLVARPGAGRPDHR